MLNTIITAILPLIIKIIVAILGIIIMALVPKLIKWIIAKIGASKFAQALIVANQVVKVLTAYFKANPQIAVTATIIYNEFKAEITSILPLSDAEVDFIFTSILADIIAAFGLNIADFSQISQIAYNPAKSYLFK
jgi:hypothetical protein